MTDARIFHRLVNAANGPGLRAVIWFQGCSLGCPGCFNPVTHDAGAGETVSVETLIDWVLTVWKENPNLEGITVSGGEPMQQLPALTEFLSWVRAHTTLGVVVFTGYSLVEIHRDPAKEAVLELADALLCGRFVQTQRVARGLIGSSNKTLYLTSPRYKYADFAPVPVSEVAITPGGEIIITGIDPVQIQA